jgi:hypothetical protein
MAMHSLTGYGNEVMCVFLDMGVCLLEVLRYPCWAKGGRDDVPIMAIGRDNPGFMNVS